MPPSPHSLSPPGSLLSGPANDVTLGGGSIPGGIRWFYGVVVRSFDGGGLRCLGEIFKCVSKALEFIGYRFVYIYNWVMIMKGGKKYSISFSY